MDVLYTGDRQNKGNTRQTEVQRDQLQVIQISYITRKVHWAMDVLYTGDRQNKGNTTQTDE